MDTEFDNIAPALIHHRIIASQAIEANTLSQPFYFDSVRLVSILYNHQGPNLDSGIVQANSDNISLENNLFRNPQNGHLIGSRSKPRSIYISSSSDNRFICDNTSDNESWTHKVRLAQNCFEQNLIAVSVSDSGSSSPGSTSGQIQIQFRSHRQITPGEELCFWPSFDLSLQLNIPFLSPANIISGSCFVCNKCGKFFSQPNPLKIHIKFACFDVLHESLLSSFNSGLDWNPWNTTTLPISGLPAIPSLWSSIGTAIIPESIQQQSPTSVAKDQADKLSLHLERISRKSYNSETGKRLHHCTYCGKVYTRKYGLKIHIRTHTGLKPLSCRFCARSFSDPSNLNKHVRLHTQSKQ